MKIRTEKAGTVGAVPGLKVTRFVSRARVQYRETTLDSNTELAATLISERYNLYAPFARTVAELAGFGGRV